MERQTHIKCPICQKEVKRLSASGHLLVHNLTFEEFKKQFPEHPTISEEYSYFLSSHQIGKIVKQETREKISRENKGNEAWNKGLRKETNEVIRLAGIQTSKTRKEKFERGELKNWNYGMIMSDEHRKILSDAHKGKTYEMMFGVEKANELKNKARLRFAENSQSNSGLVCPFYNTKAIDVFKKFDEHFNTCGFYATHPFEFCVLQLGYWLDYINFDLKIIIEYDEPYHFKRDGSLRQKDIERQEKIQKQFFDFKFYRIKQSSLPETLDGKWFESFILNCYERD